MEMGSSSLAASGASASTDSLNGLKFGKKIYFEDLGVGISAKTSSLSGSSTSSVTMVTRKRRSVVQGGQPPTCQVEGCTVDLSGAKAYYRRHKVCGMHSKFPKVIVNGLEQRFCQQCSRFHQLPEFDQGKRSCRRRLAGHNERRRKPPLGSLTSSYGQLPSSFNEDNSRVGGFLDFTYPRSAGREVCSTAKYPLHLWQGRGEVPSANVFLTQGPHQHRQASAGGSDFTSSGIPSSDCFVGISNTSCALSLLSSQSWGPRNRASGMEANNFMNDEGVPLVKSTSNFMSNAWSFRSQEASSSSNEILCELGMGQVPESISSQFSGELESARQANKQYMENGQPRAYGSSSNQMHWSL